jgi:hypothetical protein
MVKSIKRKNRKNKSKRRGGFKPSLPKLANLSKISVSNFVPTVGQVVNSFKSKEQIEREAKIEKERREKEFKELNSQFITKGTPTFSLSGSSVPMSNNVKQFSINQLKKSGVPQEQLTQMFSLVGKTLQNKIK